MEFEGAPERPIRCCETFSNATLQASCMLRPLVNASFDLLRCLASGDLELSYWKN